MLNSSLIIQAKASPITRYKNQGGEVIVAVDQDEEGD
jgi:hypothetical protein